ncbi:MAG: glycosyltransferase family 9 protein [Sulfurimonas sp.]
MNIPLHVTIRKLINDFINWLLSFANKNPNNNEFIDKDEIRSIIIVRPNYRIGNLIFLTPLINELAKHLPHAKVDIIVGMKLAGKILLPLPNVQKIIDIPRELLLHPMDMYHFIKDVRAKKYDLAINIMGASTSSQIVTSLINARYKASYYNEKSWGKLTHTTPLKRLYNHIGLESLELIRLFDIQAPKENLKLDIKLTKEEIQGAKEDLKSLLQNATITKQTKTIALFRNARFDKKITDIWWEEWLNALYELNKNILVIDILSPDIPTKLNDKVLEYSNKNLRALGAFFHECDLYVSADTGPMHLAAASDAKVLALFNKTSIQAYGALGEKNKTIDINDLSVQDVAKITQDFL